jgi:hypothetical protein
MEHCLIRKKWSELLILTEEFALHLGSCTRLGKPTFPYLWPVTGVFQNKIYCVEGQSCFVCDRDNTVISCLELCISLTCYRRNAWQMATSGKVMEWKRLVFLTRPSSRVLRDSTHAVQVNCILMNRAVSRSRNLLCPFTTLGTNTQRRLGLLSSRMWHRVVWWLPNLRGNLLPPSSVFYP